MPRRLAKAFNVPLRRSPSVYQNPNEAVTEHELIRPVLELLGWTDYLPQQGAARNEDIPDLLLFADSDSKTRAAARNQPEPALRRRAGSRGEQAVRTRRSTPVTRTT